MEILSSTVVAALVGVFMSSIISVIYNSRKYKLEVLLAAFQDEKNDKNSRIEAWEAYKKAGGHNYNNYLTKLKELSN